MRSTTLTLPNPHLDDPKTGQSHCQRQAEPRYVEPYAMVWRRRNNIPPAGAIETPPAQQAPVPVTAVWRQRAATRLHDLGPRPVLEALIAVAGGGDLDGVLADFARLDPDIVHALRGDAFPRNVFAVAGR